MDTNRGPRPITSTLVRIIAGLALAAGLVLLAGCGAEKPDKPDQPTRVVFAGEVEDGESFVGLVREGDAVLAYVCDSNSVSRWFRGKVDASGAFSLVHASGDTLMGKVGEDAVTGTFTGAGIAHPLTAATAIGNTGLYRAEDDVDGTARLAGWIVLADGRQRGAVQEGASATPAPVLDPATGAAGSGAEAFQATAAGATPPTPSTTSTEPAASSAVPETVATTSATRATSVAAAAPTGAAVTAAPITSPASAGPTGTTPAGSSAAPPTSIGSTTTPLTSTGVTSTTIAGTTTSGPTSTSLAQLSCRVNALPGLVLDLQLRSQPLVIGFPNLGQLTLGAVTATGPCNGNTVVTFTNGSATLLRGFLTGTALSGTIDKQRTCFTGGTFSARNDLGLPALPVAGGMCVGYDSAFNAANALNNLFPGIGGSGGAGGTTPTTVPSPGAIGIPPELGPLCPGSGTGALKGSLRWTDVFPAMQLPTGFVFRDGLIDFACDHVRVSAQMGVPGGGAGAVSFDGTGRTDNSFTATVAFSGVPVLGSPLDFTGTVTGSAAGGPLTYDIAAQLQNATFGIPGFNLRTGEVRFTKDAVTFSGKATAAAGELALNLSGAYRAEDDFSVALTADSGDPKGTGTWKPAPVLLPTFEVPRANFAGTLSRNHTPVRFDVQASLAAPVTLVAQTVVVNTASVRIANVAPPAGCPIQADEAWIDLSGSGRLTIPQAPIVDLAASSCLGLQSGQFRLATTADLNSWKPRADVDLTVEGFGFELRSVAGQLQVSGDGELKFQNAHGLARVEYRPPSTLIVDGGVNLADLNAGGGSGHLILATQPVTGYVNPNDPNLGNVDLVAGLTAVASISIDAGTRTFLVQKLGVPAGSVPDRLQAKAQIGGASIRLEASLQFPAPGLPFFESCPQGQLCNADTKTSMHLASLFFRIDTTGSLGLGAAVNLHLPKPSSGKGTASDVQLVGVFTVTPPATLGIQLSMVGTLNNALGIDGFALKDVAVQGALDFSASGVPVPVQLGFTATVESLPTFLRDPLGVVGNEPMKFALNIAPTAPIFQITLGLDNDVTFLKPLKIINNGQFQDQLTVDFAEVYFAPLGGNIGEIAFTPGINVQFAGTIGGTPVDAQLKLDPATLTMTGKLLAGSFTVSGATIQDTDLSVVMQPTKFDMTVKGGIVLPNGGPTALVDGHLLVQAAPTDPIRLDLTANATNWTVSPGTVFSTFQLEAHGGLPSLAATPNLSLGVTANGSVLGTALNFGGGLVFNAGELRFLALQVNPATMNVAGTMVSGSGCQERISVPAGITLATLPPVTSAGVCVQFSYAKTGANAAVVAMKVNGKLTTAGIEAAVAGSVDATGLAFSGTLKIPQFSTSIDGRLFSGTAADLATLPAAQRPRNASNVAVVPVTGDWRLAGTFAPTGALNGTSLNLIGGRVGGAEFVKGNGTLVVGGQALANGAISFTTTQMSLSGGLVLPLPPKDGQAAGTKVTVDVAGTTTYPTATSGIDVRFTGNVNVAGGTVASTAAADFHFTERPKDSTNRLDFDGTATKWPLNPATMLDRLVVGFHADIPKTGLAANATANVSADLTVLDTPVSLSGQGTMTQGVVTAFDLSAGTGQITVGATTISGAGCPGKPATTGPCVQLIYAAGPPLVAQAKVNGKLVTPGLTTSFSGTVGTTGVAFTGSTTMPNADVVTVNGSIVTAAGSGITVVKANAGGTESTVIAVKGDVSFAGTWSPSGLLTNSSLALRSGRVAGVGFGHAKGNLVLVALSLGAGRVTFTDTGSTVFGSVTLPLPALPACTALDGTAPLSLTVNGAFSANDVVLTGSQSQTACTDSPSIEGRVEAHRTGSGSTSAITLLLKGTARNWTFGPTKLTELSASLGSANGTTATVAAKASLMGAAFEGSGTATMQSGRVKAFNLPASTAPLVLSGATTISAVPGATCGATALGGPCFTLDFDSARVAADQLRASFSGAATVSGLSATLAGVVGNGQTTVEGTLDTGQFGNITVVGSLFTATPASRTAIVTKDGRSYNLGSIATAAGANLNNAVKGDVVLGMKSAAPANSAIAGFPLGQLVLDAGRIGSVQWVRGTGNAAIGDSSLNVSGTVKKVSGNLQTAFHGDGSLVVGGFTLANGTADLTETSATLHGRVTVANPSGGTAFVDVQLDGTSCMTRCSALFPGIQKIGATSPAFSFDLAGSASLKIDGFSAAGDFRLRQTTGAVSFTYTGGIDTNILTAQLSGSLTKSGSVVSICASGSGSIKVSGTNPSGSVKFCTNPGTVHVDLDRGPYHLIGDITSTSIVLDATTDGVWLANDWHIPCRDGFTNCRDRVEYTLKGKLRFSGGSGSAAFGVSGSGSADWRTDRSNSTPSSSARTNSVFVQSVSFSTSPLQVCILGLCSPTLG